MAWGLEARVPFLDKEFLEVAMNVDPKEKMFSKGSQQEFDADGCPKMEKYIIRKAFDCAPDGKVSKSANLPLVLMCIDPNMLVALPSSFDLMASEGAIL